MCRPVPCSTCKKTTWSGCGAHVDSVMSAVPASQRCTCERDTAKRGLLDRILGR
ncbi:hypothetical protein [Rhodococcus triatomae]